MDNKYAIEAAKWLTNYIQGLLNKKGLDVENIIMTPEMYGILITWFCDGLITRNTFKEILNDLVRKRS